MIKKRFLLVTNPFPPDIGGPATFISDLAYELAALGYPVTVACQSDRASDPGDTARPYRVRRIQRLRLRLNSLWVYLNLLALVPRHDVIFCNTLDAYLEPVARLLKRTYVLKIVGDMAWEYARNFGLTELSLEEFQNAPMPVAVARIARRQRNRALRAERVIIPGESRRQQIIAWGVPPEQVITIHNGIRLNEFEAVQPCQRNSGPLRLLFVGRLIALKGIGYLLEALAGMDQVHLTIVGDGPIQAQLEAQARDLHVSASFSGKVPRSQVLQMMTESHGLALPSQSEGLSHTLLEACASGLACIASDRGGNPEVITDGVNGLLVPYGDVAALRSAILRLRDDEAERYRLARAAKERSADFDFRKTLEATIEILLSD